MKQINVKQAERWLEKLKQENQQSYKDITKFLRKYEKTEDEYDCYIKMSHTLLSHSALTNELNNFLEDGNKFVVNKPENDKIKDLMAYVKRNRPDTFVRIIEMIHAMSTAKNETAQNLNKNLKCCLREIIKGDEELQRITEQALNLTGEELINRQDLEHLKVKKGVNTIEEEAYEDYDKERGEEKKGGKKQGKKPMQRDMEGQKKDVVNRRPQPFNFNNFTSVSQERNVFKHFQKNLDEVTYNYIIKIVKIYFLNIITRNEAFQLLNLLKLDQEIEYLKDILDARQTERRKNSEFRCLNDLNFSNCERASPSYVTIPFSYPIRCSGRTDEIRKLMNQKWVSVPQGSEESENFSVRNKNANEINLLKAEDQRYEFDLYMRRLEKTLQLFDRLLDDNIKKSEAQRQKIVTKIIEIGGIQMIYKNCNKDQKEELEWYLKIKETETCRVFRERISIQISELKAIKDVHANKNWSQIAIRNFAKALDLKGFQFKKNEKQRMKGTYFIAELNERTKILDNGGEGKTSLISFQDKKDFFSVLNSFQSSSRTEKCTSRALPQIENFDLKDEKKRHFYPVMILAFEDSNICKKVYSLILLYLDSTQLGQPEKLRCKLFLQQFLVHYLGWSLPQKRVLTDKFDEEKLYMKIAKGSEEETDVKDWLISEKEDELGMINENAEEATTKFNSMNDHPSEYSYLPTKSESKSVVYGSEHLYTFVRFIYALYQRFIRMKEVAQSQEKIYLFELLFIACIKAKEGVRFEQNLNILFGKYAYLFSTCYKLFDNLIKSISNVANCQITTYSFKLMSEQSEDIYFVLLNRFILQSNASTSKILRFTFQKNSKTLYLNYLQSYYKSDDPSKEVMRKRLDINKGIEIYTFDNFCLNKKKKKIDVIEMNNLEYTFQGSTIKMLNHQEREDVLIHLGRRQPITKYIKRELKRTHKIFDPK